MIREKIFIIAYESCRGGNLIWNKNPFQYNNAIRLIIVCILLHLLQFISLIEKNILVSIKHFTPIQYLIFICCCVLLIYGVEKVFSKTILAKALKLYKGSEATNYSKPIAYSYLIGNLILLIAIINFSR